MTRIANEPAFAFRIVDLGTLEASDASRFARLFSEFARICRALGISDPEADTDFAVMFAGVGASVGTRALPSEAPGRAAMAGTDRSGCG